MTKTKTKTETGTKRFADPGIDQMPAIDQAVVAEAEAAWSVRNEDPERWRQAKQLLRERRRYWREIGEATGARTFIKTEEG